MAWQRIQTKYPNVIATEDEDQITDQLLTELAAMRKTNQPAGFNSNLFGMPYRDGKLPNAAGTSKDQMPDLTIYLAHPRSGVADDRHDGLFYECKVLKGRRNLGLYSKNGIQRFIDGQYAWRMPHAGMIAYVFNPSQKSPVTALTKYFSRKSSSKATVGSALGCNSLPTVEMNAPNANVSDIVKTVHTRAASNPNLGDIELRHVWFF